MPDPAGTDPAGADLPSARPRRRWRRNSRWFGEFPGWLRMAVAAASVVLGVTLLLRPVASLGVLALLFGAALVLTGVLELAGGGSGEAGRPPRWRVTVAVLWIAAGVFVLLWLGLTVRVLVLVVAGALIVNGALSTLSALRRGTAHGRTTLDARIATGLLGVAGIVFGVLAAVWPDVTLLVVGVAFGVRLIVVGLIELGQAWRASRPARVRAAPSARPGLFARGARTVAAVLALVLAIGAGAVTLSLRAGSIVVDDFYAAPRVVPAQPGQLIRAEEFTRGMPDGSRAWRILYTTTDGAGRPAVASGLVVTPARGEGDWPVIDWAHGTTGFAQQCAPALLPGPFESGALYIAPDVVDRGWAIVATDYLGLGTVGPHPYLIGVPSAHAVLDARRAAAQLDEARLGTQTVVWGHSQGGGAALWTGALAEAYAPDLELAGVVALAPASSPPALIGGVADVTGGSIFASFAIAAYTAVYDDVTYREYVRPGLEPIARTLASRCLSEPGTVVSILTSLGLSADPEIFSTDPTAGPLGRRLEENIPPATVSAPLLIGQGGGDELVTPAAQSAFVDDWCSGGQSLEYTVYPGLGHLALVEPGSPAVDDVFAWTAARFAGEPTDTGCHRVDR